MHKRASDLYKKIHTERKTKKKLKKIRNNEYFSNIAASNNNFDLARILIMIGIAFTLIFSGIGLNLTASGKTQDKHLPDNKLSAKSLLKKNQTIVKIPIENNKFSLTSSKPKIEKSKLGLEMSAIIKNAPMSVMISDIALRDKKVAAYLVGIAMKESKFGKYSPKKNGVDCFNYWGYRGKENPTLSGYSCFDSPQQAVKIVGDRIEKLVNRGIDNPAEMVVWKCGSSCNAFTQESVKKWISDVSIHYYQLNPPDEQLARK